MNYGYARVSTIKQGRGNSLEEQLSELFSSGCDEVIEEKFSGKRGSVWERQSGRKSPRFWLVFGEEKSRSFT